VRLAEPVAFFLLAGAAATPAAAQAVPFDLPAGRLSDSLVALGQQAGLTVGASDPGLASVPSRPLRGRMSARAALTRLLDGTGYGFRFVGPRTVRIVRARRIARPRPAPWPTQVAPPPPPVAEPDIVVTATKHNVTLDRFPGTARLVDLGPSDVGRFGARGTDAVLARLPVLSATDLGPGRNKIFIRGLADSSFNGPSQVTVGQYLGDVRLTYNAPDPDLRLYDVSRVEVLEGPQGTLYGTGALGGILRLVPNAPDPNAVSASASGGAMFVGHGDPGADLAGMVNLPLADRLALRAVGYGSIDGGYIDDLERGREDVNRISTYGGRATLLLLAPDGLEVQLGTALQSISGRDGQYSQRGVGRLERRSTLGQPFGNDYRLGALSLRRRWPGLEFQSATSMVRHELQSSFDASGLAGTTGPQLFVEDIGITLLANETRLSRPMTDGEGWVVGLSLLHNIGSIRRRLGPPDATIPIIGVRNNATEAALFGEYSRQLDDRLVATLGARAVYSQSLGQPLEAPDDLDIPSRRDVRLSPSAALSWRGNPGLLLYARYQQAFRPGGLAVAATGSSTSVELYESDKLAAVEAGMRLGRRGAPFSLNLALSYARWTDIQADLIDDRGLPFTTNIGDGRIYGFELDAGLRVTRSLRFDLALFLTESELTRPNREVVDGGDRDLPNVAGAGPGGRLTGHYRAGIASGIELTVDASVRYIGPSLLGVDAPLDVRQGDFADGQIGARLDFGRFGISLDVDNVADARGSRFSFGNPFGVGDRDQVTPIRPRTVRIGFDANF
jgi:outer membrane receptor protein involved in Fe transport